ncbi:protealysin inhibitor emfourin [Microbacterium phosphatis]|uniref:protealysin inhibitor emfourin n=1 Tax=Microbacterium phosphatis TaxID=3140248 RepID=UPI0031402EAD
MRVTVVRTGGFAGLRATWEVRIDEQPDRREWRELVESLPWDTAPSDPPGEPDRYVYRITCEQHEAVLGERQLADPWRAFVDRVRAVAAAGGDAPAPREG